jgi:Cd2+/Zn2+-exporting ATPase
MDHEAACCTTHQHSEDEHEHEENLFLPAGISFGLLGIGLILDYLVKPSFFQDYWRLALYTAAYLPVGLPVIKNALKGIAKKDIFSEFFLMSIATIGAFILGEYPEGVAVMLFYSVGEAFQEMAVQKAKNNIKSLLDQRPDEVNVLKDGSTLNIKATEAKVGDIVRLRPGEKMALDGILLTESASFNTAALTGESTPDTKRKGEVVLAGMINVQQVADIEITTLYEDSKLSKILALVQNAASQKAPTELFIRKFARIYTPIVVFLAVAICILPYFFVADYSLKEWLYRALIFLVISCPCALVISIPLGYFGGIGAASKNGILIKGGNILDLLAKVDHVVMDKTGTLTEGVFEVQSHTLTENQQKYLDWINALESHSTHPVATAIAKYVGTVKKDIVFEEVEEVPGHGLKGRIEGKTLLVGNFKLLKRENIPYPVDPDSLPGTILAVAYGGTYIGYISIADKIKSTAKEAILQLKEAGVQATMLSGDKANVVSSVAKELGIKNAYGDLLPEDKVQHLKSIKNTTNTVAFVGDGINDAPVVALSDIGIAMGGLGSDATIETADAVIQDDNPLKLPIAIRIGKMTKKIVWQNIGLAFGVKAIVLILGAGGLATMWEAVFADVGVAFLAILNAIRIQKTSFR